MISEFKLSACRIQILKHSSNVWLAVMISQNDASDDVLQNEVHELLNILSELASVDAAAINGPSWPLMVYDAVESLFYQHFCF